LFGIPMTGLRFFTVYGPWGRPDMALFKFTKAILAGETIQVFNHGKMVRDFTYIDDIVEGVIRVVDRPALADAGWSSAQPTPASSSAPYRIFNIGNNEPVELMRYIHAIEAATGRDFPLTSARLRAIRETTIFPCDKLLAAGFRHPQTTIRGGQGAEAEGDVAFDSEVREQCVILEHQADVATFRG
jgi:UDP-glucuronate 4-epimerase